jgi:hypothetical protein
VVVTVIASKIWILGAPHTVSVAFRYLQYSLGQKI